MKKIKFLLSLSILALFSACSSTVPVFIMDTKVVNGGDDKPYGEFNNNKATAINNGDCVVFYKGKDQKKYYSRGSTISEVEIGKVVMAEMKAAEPEPRLLFTKYASISQIDKMSPLYKDKKNVPLNYNISIQNIGSAKVSEIIIVDALPDRFELTDVQYWTTVYVGAARFKDNGFDKINWEVKKKNGVNYLIIKIVMESDPMGTPGWMDVMTLQLTGNLNIE